MRSLQGALIAMPEMTDVAAPLRRLTPAGEHFFFGYYDIPAADSQGRHLALKVPFRDRFPDPTDEAELGWVPLPSMQKTTAESFHPFASTVAWNFQQACMLQWLPRPDTCLYNTFGDSRFGCAIRNISSGAVCNLPLAVANVSQDGTKALCVNMPRIYDFRAGYGYEEIPDPYATVPAPSDDGVFLMDLATGENRLILSLAEAVDFLARQGENIAGQKVVVNHITFNPSGDRYLFLLRSFPEPGQPWSTWLVTADSNGGGLRHRQAFGVASHYHWKDDRGMLFYMRVDPKKLELVLVDDQTDERTLIDTSYFLSDGHCSYSPCGKWLLYDSYPDGSTPDYMRSLYVYDLKKKQGYTLGKFRSESYKPETVDLRCDLHPRWMPDGKSVTFDSIHEGYRGIYWMDLSEIMGR